MMTHFILYVKDQRSSAEFYSSVLQKDPTLDVPGMTEFKVGEECILGLMPEANIKKLLGATLPDPATANGVPRAEVYLHVDSVGPFYNRALDRGAKPLSQEALRDWGHVVAYCLDPDGHVLAFAKVPE